MTASAGGRQILKIDELRRPGRSSPGLRRGPPGGSIPAVNAPTPHLPPGCTRVREEPAPGLPALVHAGWARAYPWLVQGTTRRGPGPDLFDLGIYSDASPAASVAGAWDRLRVGSGCRTVVHARQVHGAAVRVHGPGVPGLHLAEACDGHATSAPGVLLAVTVADCVPVFLVDPDRRAVALLHAGWRGAAGGILERGVQVLRDRMGSAPAALRAHLGPSICGACYEVGPEVFAALGLDPPAAPAPVDLRSVLAARAVAVGLDAAHVTVSEHCTLCGDAGLFSHRRGERARQAGYLGIRG